MIFVSTPSINHVVRGAALVPGVVRSNHDVVSCALAQEHEPHTSVEVVIRVEPHLGEIYIPPLGVVRYVFQPLALCKYILAPPGVDAVCK